MPNHGDRILRNYHNLGPKLFHEFNQRVCSALSDKTRFPDSFWAIISALFTSYLATSQKFDMLYHEAKHGSRLVIAERDLLQGQLVLNLDELAAFLEMCAVRNPDILLASGFDLYKDRRGNPRSKANAAARYASQSEQEDGETGTPA